MKEVMAVVRMNKMNQTKKALADAGIYSMTARDALGRGKGIVDMDLLDGVEKGYEEAIVQLGQTGRLVPKRVLIMVLPDKLVQTAVTTVIRENQTGKSGDGMIYVMPVSEAVSVRTGEKDDAALDSAG